MRIAADGSHLAIGLSPHSPYALSEELLSGCQGLVEQTGVAPAIHAAESPEESEFLTTGEGPIRRSLYPAVGCLDPPPRGRARSAVAYLAGLGVLAWRPLLVHTVHVDEADCRTLAGAGVRVAHCPRSNARLSRGVAPVPLLLAHGIPVGLGTDSLAAHPAWICGTRCAQPWRRTRADWTRRPRWRWGRWAGPEPSAWRIAWAAWRQARMPISSRWLPPGRSRRGRSGRIAVGAGTREDVLLSLILPLDRQPQLQGPRRARRPLRFTWPPPRSPLPPPRWDD